MLVYIQQAAADKGLRLPEGFISWWTLSARHIAR